MTARSKTIAEDLADGSPEAMQRVLSDGADAKEIAQENLAAARLDRDDFQA